MSTLRKSCIRAPQSSSMRADFYSSDESLLLLVDAPGVAQEDVSVSVQERQLLVEGPHKTEPSERFRRAFRISEKYDLLGTSATTSRGVIRIEIPKRPESKTVRIPVNAA